MEVLGKSEFNLEECPIAFSVSEIGDKWSLLLIRDLFFGFSRFEQFQKRLSISKSVLSTKLKNLLEKEIVKLHRYKESGQRERKEYRLTRKGYQLAFVMASMIQWGNDQMEKTEGDFLQISNLKGEPVKLVFSDASGRELRMDEIEVSFFRKDLIPSVK